MKLTREQIKKWNAQAKNGFMIDLEFLLMHGEKTLIKLIDIAEGVKIEFKLWYIEEREQRTNQYGCRWTVGTGRQIPVLSVNLWRSTGTGSMYSSVPIGEQFRKMGEPEKNKKYSTLCRISGEINAEEYAEKWAAENLESIGSIPTTYRVV